MPAAPSSLTLRAAAGRAAVEKVPLPVSWDGESLILLDQCVLPERVVLQPQDSVETVFRAIQELRVRGAPAIGIAAAYGLVLGLKPLRGAAPAEFAEAMESQARMLARARPTAVNLAWALGQVTGAVRRKLRKAGVSAEDLWQEAERQALTTDREEAEACLRIARLALPFLEPRKRILTYCNAGAIGTTGIGTALAPLYLGHQRGCKWRVYACETRPLLQGARLTAWELGLMGIDVSLLCDNMAATMLVSGQIDAVIVGADRIAANGDVINKIGTLSVALAARYGGVPFYVAAPVSTLDKDLQQGQDAIIEQRSEEEVTQIRGVQLAPPGIVAVNPAFDVTPAELVSAIITDRAVVSPPFAAALAELETGPG